MRNRFEVLRKSGTIRLFRKFFQGCPDSHGVLRKSVRALLRHCDYAFRCNVSRTKHAASERSCFLRRMHGQSTRIITCHHRCFRSRTVFQNWGTRRRRRGPGKIARSAWPRCHSVSAGLFSAPSEQLDTASDPRYRVAIFDLDERPSCPWNVNWTTLPDTNVRVLLIRQPEYFDRRQLYQEHGHGYVDNCERFCFFSRAVMEICRQMILRPDVMHCNDWQTGLINGLLQTQYQGRPGFERTAGVMTLHNMAYQGQILALRYAADWHGLAILQSESDGSLGGSESVEDRDRLC